MSSFQAEQIRREVRADTWQQWERAPDGNAKAFTQSRGGREAGRAAATSPGDRPPAYPGSPGPGGEPRAPVHGHMVVFSENE